MADLAADARLVVDFLNTLDVESGADVLDEAPAWVAWCASRGLGAPSTTRRARQVRDGLRSAVGDPDAPPATVSVPVTIAIRDGRPGVDAPDALGTVLAATLRVADAGDWPRLKICPADTCRWAFLDRSRNRSRSWCSMDVCGNRAKARAFRDRGRRG